MTEVLTPEIRQFVAKYRNHRGEYYRWGHVFSVAYGTKRKLKTPTELVYTPCPGSIHYTFPWIFDSVKWDRQLVESYCAMTDCFDKFPGQWPHYEMLIERAKRTVDNFYGIVLPGASAHALQEWFHRRWINSDRHMPKFFQGLDSLRVQPISQVRSITEFSNDEHSRIGTSG